jgi:TPP-dependent pyruvate/acetoin dehydrogenase alpha subunit
MLLVRTQLPQAVGFAYSLKMDKKDSCVVTYTGDGGTSEVITQQVLSHFTSSSRIL